MPANNEAKKRDFVNQMLIIYEQNAQLFIDKGYNPAERINELKVKHDKAIEAEARQLDAFARAKDATRESNKALTEAYDDASAAVNLSEGLLGKDHALVKQMRKLRK